MGWKETGREEYSCSCGMGKYIVIRKINDRNFINTSAYIQCCVCEKAESEVILYEYQKNGLWHTVFHKLKINEFNKAKYLVSQAESSLVKANDLLEKRYLNQWLSFFKGKRRKEIWRLLTDSGSEYPALSTFYRQIKEDGPEKYLKEYFKNNRQKVFKFLNIKDSEVQHNFNQAELFYKQLEHIILTC